MVNEAIPKECQDCICAMVCSIDYIPKSKECIQFKKKYEEEKD